MKILIVAATAAEFTPPPSRDHDVTRLVTGVGMVATAVHCTRALMGSRFDLALNVGVCGSFRSSIPPGTVVHVVADQMPELGAQDGGEFISLQQIGLLAADDPPYKGGLLVNSAPPTIPALIELPAVTGITVNTVHGENEAIARVVSRVDPDVESMEGAGFMYACLLQGVPFAQVRAVSNIVERRNREAWKLPEAIEALRGAVSRIIGQA